MILGRVQVWLLALGLLAGLPGAGRAETLTALAHPVPGQAVVQDRGAGVELSLGLSQGVPWRLFTLADPWRLVLDFSQVDWTGFDAEAFDRSEHVLAVRTGGLGPGWSRMVLELDGPMKVAQAALSGAEPAGPVLGLSLEPQDAEAFRAAAGVPESARFTLPEDARPPATPIRRQDGSRPVMVVLDPGHGGVDPGAEHGGEVEAKLMLTFALELQEVLLRAGFEVLLTRHDDSFVPLEARVSIARAAGADVFLSLHADAVTEGVAHGATVYTLAENASDSASRKLAERHDREDLLAGVDLTDQDDVIAGVLMDLARLETQPRSERLADALVAGLRRSIGALHKRPRLEADFSVLKAPDIPSVLLELGFLSSARDRKRLTDPAWRARAAAGIRDALLAWAKADAAEARLVRK
ncbi:N-acetylmuramoyl-L-alanine amidase [Frigidibacter sp. ROC022]|uniref:N-acetylmuramoyl-L-alanine amidase n=1 Tax=Frigidibacter sp. ROC022 TaxID=2971796 RepID=UPI00215A1E0E|nr:N-acetylmuramoyl-L-alanine amidase [Frigidibacter sp. ROC022]MCR8725694.1 N-acetylmuramoyl-L-alanine amidase [Frigidibacter sp. ROC022]